RRSGSLYHPCCRRACREGGEGGRAGAAVRGDGSWCAGPYARRANEGSGGEHGLRAGRHASRSTLRDQGGEVSRQDLLPPLAAEGRLALTEPELIDWGVRLGRQINQPLIITLDGDLGAGKTTLASAICTGYGVSA